MELRAEIDEKIMLIEAKKLRRDATRLVSRADRIDTGVSGNALLRLDCLDDAEILTLKAEKLEIEEKLSRKMRAADMGAEIQAGGRGE